MIGPPERKHGIQLFWVGICTESSLNTWNSFSEILLKTLKNKASLIMTATLHKSDFVKHNATNKTNRFIELFAHVKFAYFTILTKLVNSKAGMQQGRDGY
jgi:hypothetical protein